MHKPIYSLQIGLYINQNRDSRMYISYPRNAYSLRFLTNRYMPLKCLYISDKLDCFKFDYY